MKQALIIFAKNLVQGKVKTRLAATIGTDSAFMVYRQLLQHAVSVTRDLPVDKLVFYSDYIEENDGWHGRYQKHVQTGNDLGEKMYNAFVTAFDAGYESVAIIGTDNPELDTIVLMEAFQQLHTRQVVIGPATDGGYYLLGLKKKCPELFQGIAWSTATVFAATVSKVREMKLTFHVLPPLSDVDEEKDLHLLRKINYED